MARRRRRRKIFRKAPIIITILLLLAVSAFLLYNYGEKWFGISIFEIITMNLTSMFLVT